MIQVSIANEQSVLPIDKGRLWRAVQAVIAAERAGEAVISVAIVDNGAIHELNRRFLAHDFATDVLSFVLESRENYLEGEVIASAEMAQQQAPRYGWSPADELLLYVVHGTLHLVGYDDVTSEATEQMRAAERRHLAALGLEVPREGVTRDGAKDEG